MSDYIALQPINAPNSYARAYNTGDPVSAHVVSEWGLAIGVQVNPDGDYVAPRPPEDSDDRAAWEAYVVSKGLDLTEARALSLDGLRDAYEADPEPEPPAHDLPANASAEGVDGAGWQNPTPVTADNLPGAGVDEEAAAYDGQRPAESAKKDVWVAYVGSRPGVDKAWAYNPDTTKADLIAWAPES